MSAQARQIGNRCHCSISFPTVPRSRRRRVRDVNRQSEVIATVDVTRERNWYTPNPLSILLGQEKSAIFPTSTTRFGIEELMEVPDFCPALGLASIFECCADHYDISDENLSGIECQISMACFNAVKRIASKKVKEFHVKIVLNVVNTEICSQQEYGDMLRDRMASDVQSAATSDADVEESDADGKGNVEGSNDQCMICLQEYSAVVDVTTMICSHRFHKECIENWLKTSLTCPICRSDVEGGSA